MSAKLHVAPDLKLPLEAVTETFAVLGKRGTGKTYTAGVLVEELIKAGQHTVIIDPTDAWWGLRSSADGKGPGLPVVIFGGPHGDLPLVEQDAEILARAIIDQSITCVLSLRHLSKGARLRFLGPLLEQLYHLKAEKRDPLMLVVDEADRVAPQKLMRGEGQERVLGAIDEIVRMGRSSGFGVLLITQRSAVISKDVLSQTEVLICTRTISPQDIAAVDAWISEHDVEDQRDTFLSSLPSLPKGDSWWWSPGWLELFKHTRVREKETFDSSYTPRAGEKPRAPKRIADIDLSALKEQLAKTIEREQARDPSHLQKRIQELERELKQVHARKEKPAADPAIAANAAALQRAVKNLRKAVEAAMKFVINVSTQNFDVAGVDKEALETAVRAAVDRAIAGVDHRLEARTKAIDQLRLQAQRTAAALKAALEGDEEVVLSVNVTKNEPFTVARAKPPGAAHAPRADREVTRSPVAEGLTPSKQRVLDAVGALERFGIPAPRRIQVALFAGYTENGHFNNMLGEMRTAGLIDYPGGGSVSLTDAGRQIARADESPFQSLDSLHDFWIRKVGTSKAKLLQSLIEAYPDPITVAELAERTGYTENGHFNNMKGELRTMGLADYPKPGYVAATDVLFPEALV